LKVDDVEFGFSTRFVRVIYLLCLHNTPIIINFDVLKYIKMIFKISTQYIFHIQQKIQYKKISREFGLEATWYCLEHGSSLFAHGLDQIAETFVIT